MGALQDLSNIWPNVAGNVTGYLEVSKEVRDQMGSLLNQTKQKKIEIKENRHVACYDVFGVEAIGDSDDEDDDPQMAVARRESIMTHQEEEERQAFSKGRNYDEGA